MSFTKKTGLNADSMDVFLLMHRLMPQEFKLAANKPDFPNSLSDIYSLRLHEHKEMQNNIRAKFTKDQLKVILSDIVSRRGVLIYLNKEVFKAHNAIAGQEDEHELLLVGQEPLKIKDISGIEILSVADRTIIETEIE